MREILYLNCVRGQVDLILEYGYLNCAKIESQSNPTFGNTLDHVKNLHYPLIKFFRHRSGFSKAKYHGYLDIIKYLVETNGKFQLLIDGSETHDVFTYLLDQNVIMLDGILMNAIYHRQIKNVNYLIQLPFMVDHDCMDHLALFGYLHALKKFQLHPNINTKLMKSAVNGGHIGIVRYLASQGFDTNECNLSDAGSYSVLKYLVQKGIQPKEEDREIILRRILQNPDRIDLYPVIEYLLEKDNSILESSMKKIIRLLDCFQSFVEIIFSYSVEVR